MNIQRRTLVTKKFQKNRRKIEWGGRTTPVGTRVPIKGDKKSGFFLYGDAERVLEFGRQRRDEGSR